MTDPYAIDWLAGLWKHEYHADDRWRVLKTIVVHSGTSFNYDR